MLGIGMQEMMIIGLVALLIFGPGKLPEVMGQAGKYYRDFRNMTSQWTGDFEKTVAEAKEMGNQLTGELGPMQKELESVTNSAKRDLNKTTRRSSSSKGKSSTKRSSSTNKSRSSKTSRTSSTKSRSSSSKSTSASRSSTSSTSKTTKAKPAPPPIASKDDPISDFSMFTPEAPARARRSRRATPSIITDPTPRHADNGHEEGGVGTTPSVTVADSALSRARQRRQQAGYAQRSA